MARLRFTELQQRPSEFLALTSLTVDAFQQLVPAFEVGFQAQMADWRLDGKPRTARRFTVYPNCPLPTPADRLLFILVYPKTSSLQVVHGRLFRMVQGNANQWIHVLLPALLAALRTVGEAPARSLTELAQRLGVTETEAASLDVPSAADTFLSDPSAEASNAAPVPLFARTAPTGASSAPKTLLNRRTVILDFGHLRMEPLKIMQVQAGAAQK